MGLKPLCPKGFNGGPGGTRTPNLLIRRSTRVVRSHHSPEWFAQQRSRVRSHPRQSTAVRREWLPTWLPELRLTGPPLDWYTESRAGSTHPTGLVRQPPRRDRHPAEGGGQGARRRRRRGRCRAVGSSLRPQAAAELRRRRAIEQRANRGRGRSPPGRGRIRHRQC